MHEMNSQARLSSRCSLKVPKYPICCIISFVAILVQSFVAISITSLTLNATITTKVVCFSRLLKCLRSRYGNSVDPDQTAPIGAVCSVSTLFASRLNSSVMLDNYLQQTTLADDIFRCIFFLAL